MKDEHGRDRDLHVKMPAGDVVTSGDLLSRYAGLSTYDDVAALVGLATVLTDALTAARTAMHRGEFGDKGRDRNVPAQVDAALRLVGRLL